MAFSFTYYTSLKKELTEKVGGITTYSRSPAKGLWKETSDKTVKDDIIIYEVMAQGLDKAWWKSCRERLEKLFRQDEIIIRTWKVELL